MLQGTVAWFNAAMGYGFITPAGGGPDIFCHWSGIESEGYRTLEKLQKVEFETDTDSDGRVVAVKVRAAS